jgi:hypothetical protein
LAIFFWLVVLVQGNVLCHLVDALGLVPATLATGDLVFDCAVEVRDERIPYTNHG